MIHIEQNEAQATGLWGMMGMVLVAIQRPPAQGVMVAIQRSLAEDHWGAGCNPAVTCSKGGLPKGGKRGSLTTASYPPAEVRTTTQGHRGGPLLSVTGAIGPAVASAPPAAVVVRQPTRRDVIDSALAASGIVPRHG